MENQTQITITAADLALLRSLVEVASSRGAFKADELSTVGQIYDKLNAFITLLIEQSDKSKDSANTESEQSTNSKEDKND
jgi:hypothetical protein